MRKNHLIAVIFVLISLNLYSQNTNTQSDEKPGKLRALFYPLENITDTNKYVNSDIVKLIIYKSLYNFILVLPSIELVEDKYKMKVPELSNLKESSKELNPDIVLFGNIELFGDRLNPDVRVKLSTWFKDEDKIVFQKKYEGTTGIDIFDTIDATIVDFMKTVFNLTVNLAKIQFHDFVLGNETHEIRLNGRPIASPSGDDFSLSMKVLADTPYDITITNLVDKKEVYHKTVNLKRDETADISYKTYTGFIQFRDFKTGGEKYRLDINGIPAGIITNGYFSKYRTHENNYNHINIIHIRDNKSVLEENIRLEGGETRIISYSAYGSVRIHTGKYQSPNRRISYMLDDTPVEGNSILTNMSAGVKHTFLTLENGVPVKKEIFYLKDGELKEFSPGESFFSFGIRIYTLDECMLGLGLDGNLGGFRLSGGWGESYYSYPDFNHNRLIFNSLYLELSYKIFEIPLFSRPLKIYLGGDYRYYFLTPIDDYNSSPYSLPMDGSSYTSYGITITPENGFLFIKTGVYFNQIGDSGNFTFVISPGIKF